MVYKRPYPPGPPDEEPLTKKQRKARKEKAKLEHAHLHKVFEDSYQVKGDTKIPMQQVFDVGRLGSPLWHKYRDLFKDKIKRGVKGKDEHEKPAKTVWESKYKNPEAFKMTKAKFLKLKNKKHIFRHILTNPEDTWSVDIPGLRGTDALNAYSILKEDMASVKHGTKVKLTAKQKNMILIPGMLVEEADRPDCTIAKMKEIWKKYGRGFLPWYYNRVFLLGTVRGDDKGGLHGILVVIEFEPGEKDIVNIWDSGHARYHHIYVNLCNWLKDENPNKYKMMRNSDLVYHDKEIPFQKDPFNCGQYMIHTAKALFRCQKPDYKDFEVPLEEDDYTADPDGKLLVGSTWNYDGSLVHPELDRSVLNFSNMKVKEYNSMVKWQTKPMKGFK
jgi:hypothetical protein